MSDSLSYFYFLVLHMYFLPPYRVPWLRDACCSVANMYLADLDLIFPTILEGTNELLVVPGTPFAVMIVAIGTCPLHMSGPMYRYRN